MERGNLVGSMGRAIRVITSKDLDMDRESIFSKTVIGTRVPGKMDCNPDLVSSIKASMRLLGSGRMDSS